jgi:hypothetical protein
MGSPPVLLVGRSIVTSKTRDLPMGWRDQMSHPDHSPEVKMKGLMPSAAQKLPVRGTGPTYSIDYITYAGKQHKGWGILKEIVAKVVYPMAFLISSTGAISPVQISKLFAPW